RPFLAESGVMTVPLRIGGGSRLKILEALACGLPVVSSRVGAEGLCLRPGEHYTEADEDAMAVALIDAIRKPAAAQALARAGLTRTPDAGLVEGAGGRLQTKKGRNGRNAPSGKTLTADSPAPPCGSTSP